MNLSTVLYFAPQMPPLQLFPHPCHSKRASNNQERIFLPHLSQSWHVKTYRNLCYMPIKASIQSALASLQSLWPDSSQLSRDQRRLSIRLSITGLDAMRLLHTLTYDVKVFFNNLPLYAILSHTWGDEEVTFQDITVAHKRGSLKGWSKVVNACRRAAADGWEYIWIDTCCIDKTDTTELGEAINSMFSWYRDAQICYAYLADVPPRYFVPSSEPRVEPSLVPWRWYFRSSRWFTRGWTLQELLAPGFLLFLDQQWGNIGAREEWADEIYRATGIGVKHLLDFQQCCIAVKLSWAANRHTTREEDRAYSLLGLLGINMPLIYGEGRRAFIRLQYELIGRYNDESIFAWGNIRSKSSVGPLPAFELIPVPQVVATGELCMQEYVLVRILASWLLL